MDLSPRRKDAKGALFGGPHSLPPIRHVLLQVWERVTTKDTENTKEEPGSRYLLRVGDHRPVGIPDWRDIYFRIERTMP